MYSQVFFDLLILKIGEINIPSHFWLIFSLISICECADPIIFIFFSKLHNILVLLNAGIYSPFALTLTTSLMSLEIKS